MLTEMDFIRRILVPVDFLNASKDAVKFAIEFAGRTGAKIYLLHAYRLIQPKILLLPYFKSPVYTGPELKKELEVYAQGLFEKIESQFFRGIEVEHEYLTEIGFPAQAIETTVNRLSIDLVIMGTHNKKRKSEFWGSNTLEVIKKGICPVLAIPDGARFKGFKSITLASDYEKVKNVNIYTFIKNWAKIFKGKLQILHLTQNNSTLSEEKLSAKKEFEKVFTGVDHSYYFKSSSDFDDGISEHLDSENTDILIIIPRGHNYFGKIFKRNLTASVFLKTKIPLLIIHE